jgi:Co/Zn/Cd efflux system component
MSRSLAIVTDAAHLLSDVSGFAVSLFAVALSQREPSAHYTYGYHQAEILGALTSVLIVWAMTGVLLFEAIQRFYDLREVDGHLMLVMATLGLIVNFALFSTLHHGHDHGHDHGHSHSHNHGHSHSHSHGHTHIHGHGGCSHGNDTRLREIPGVMCCHDVHVWSVGSSNVIATVHVVVDSCNSCGDVLRACKKVAEEMGIGHSTFQIEVDGNFDHAQETFGDLHERDEQCCDATSGVRGHTHV